MGNRTGKGDPSEQLDVKGPLGTTAPEDGCAPPVCTVSGRQPRGLSGGLPAPRARWPLRKDTVWTWDQGSFISVAWVSYLPAGLFTE